LTCFVFSYNLFILLYNRNYKQPNIGANFRSELEAADNIPNQTESMITSNDAAVNTGISLFCIQILSLSITKKNKNLVSHGD
jgi:hypothetical protein